VKETAVPVLFIRYR